MEENNKPLQPQTTPTPQQQEVKAPKISVILMLIFVLGLPAGSAASGSNGVAHHQRGI